MARELLVLRHGKSDWTSGAERDFDRPLAKRGRKASKRMGEWLRDSGLAPDHVVSSPAERARQTVERFCEAAGLDASAIEWAPAVYDAELVDLLSVLGNCPPAARRVLLVGHNPGLEELVRHLGGESVQIPADGKLVPTATIARLEMPDDWQRLPAGCARLAELTRARSLK